jgi:hypothetical protein
MKRLAFAFAILALGLAAATPARADYAVVKWDDGFCHIWWNAGATPWGAGWATIAVAPDWETAWFTLESSIRSGDCR